MTDYQFHSADCPLWHPDKFVAGGSVSKCWCQRWSNLVDWNVSSGLTGEGGLLSEVKKDPPPEKTPTPRPRPNQTLALQTDAFLGSNLWSMEELKFEQDPTADLDLLWKKLDSPESPAVDTKPSPTSVASSSSLSPSSSSFVSPVEAVARSPISLNAPDLNVNVPMDMASVGSCLDSLGIAGMQVNVGLDDLSKSPLGLDPAALFEDPNGIPSVPLLPSPTAVVAAAVPPPVTADADRTSAGTAGDAKPAPKRRGRPPGKANSGAPKEPKRPRKRSPSLTESIGSIGSDIFDPTSFIITPDDLKPVSVVKKSKKKLTPEDAKDDKYWARRKKNNLAAKRSRDIRRLKENQIALRAAFLESEILRVKTEMEEVRAENEALRRRLEALESVKH